MRIAYLDCFSGISGDMFLGALLDVGVSTHLFEQTVAALNIGAQLEISRVNRSGITATKVDVLVGSEKELPREVYWEQQAQRHGSDHTPDHAHEHGHAQPHQHPHHAHSHGHEPGRSLSEIRRIISGSPLSDVTKATAIVIFETLGAAEAKMHNVDIEAVHFHEV